MEVGPQCPSTTVLLVEDDDILRGLMVMVLQRAGFRVFAAASAGEALATAQLLHEPPAVLVTDLTLPDMGGASLALAILRHCGTLRVVVTSGRPLDTLEMMADLNAIFLRKPFSVNALVDAVSVPVM